MVLNSTNIKVRLGFHGNLPSLTALVHLPGNSPPKVSVAPPPGSPVYVDLAYVPNHCSAKNVDQEFFKRVRAAYYVVSGNDAGGGEPSRRVLDALLDAKAQWGSNLQVRPLRAPRRCFLSRQLSQLPFAFLPTEGDPDPDPRHGGDPGLVPADPREAAGPQHHGSGVQQHRGHAGRVLPRLQDRVLSWACSAALPLPRPILSLAIVRTALHPSFSWFRSSTHSPQRRHLRFR